MRRDRTVLIIATLGLTLAAGCAGDLKRRVAMLEDANANLAEQVNMSREELDDAQAQRDELNRNLEEARAEAESLRTLLASEREAEPAAAGWTPVPGGAMIAIDGNVLFAPGRAVLRKESRRTLEAIVSTVSGDYADKDILVFGHTDDRPISKSGWTDNWQLSTERALSVVRYLQERGVAPSRLVACGCGEHRATVPNESEANRAKNRRVEIFAIEPQGSPGR